MDFMSEEKNDDLNQNENAATVEPKSTDEGQDSPKEESISQERFNQMFARTKSAEEKLKKLEAERESQQAKALEEQGKYKELYEKEKTEREAQTKSHNDFLVETEMRRVATQLGMIDQDLIKLIGREGITIENGQVQGVEDVIKEFQKNKPALFKSDEVETPKVPNVSQSRPGTQTVNNANFDAELNAATTREEINAVYTKYGVNANNQQSSFFTMRK